MRDHYDTLEVPQDATVEEIRAAYRFQLKAFHPDKFSPESVDAKKAQERIHRTLEAYSVLSNERSRGEYDHFLTHTSPLSRASVSATPASRAPKHHKRAVYISAPADELRSAIEIVAEELKALGYATICGGPSEDQEDARPMIRKRISRCRAVIQLLGHSFGAEPPTVDPNFGRVSYPQYEGMCARQLGKPIHYLFLSKDFPVDAAAQEAAELRNLQSAYRRRLRIVDHPHLSQQIGSSEALRLNVRALAPRLAGTRRGRMKRLWIPIAALLAIGLGVWLFPERRTSREIVVGVPEPAVPQSEVTDVVVPVPQPRVESEPDASPAEGPPVTATGIPPLIKAPHADTEIPEGSIFGIGDVTVEGGPEGILKLRVTIEAQTLVLVDHTKVNIQVFFYDLMDGKEVVLTNADVTYQWLTPGHDWKASNAETLLITYSPTTVGTARQYLGYIVRVYYREELQVVRAAPERLLNLFPPPFRAPNSDVAKRHPTPSNDLPYQDSQAFTQHAIKLREAMRVEDDTQVFTPTTSRAEMTRYPWKTNIVTATFFIGESVQGKQRKESAWDPEWLKNYGGPDPPEQPQRRDYIPTSFVPAQNPFYCALPYNDLIGNKLKPEAPLVIPWFKQAFTGEGYSVCRGRWLAIRKGNKTAYAQWEDAGPFRTDHYQYVFQNERPTPNPKRGAGLSVSPAVRDYLDLDSIDVTDWQFVEVRDVPPGPWRTYGDNNHFVIAKRQAEHHGELKPSKKQDKDQRDSDRIGDFEASVQTQAAWEKETKGDYAAAVKLYQAPVAHGNRYALTNLAKLYLLGKGVPRDEAKAQALLEKAAAQNHEEAQQMLDSFFPNRTTSTPSPASAATANESGAPSKAVVVSAPRPEYPLQARRSRITGSGVCVMTIDTRTGAVTSATMAQSTGNALLDHAATSAFRRWRFKAGSPPKVRMPVTFTMSGVRY